MGEIEVKHRYAPLRRTVKLCIDLPGYTTYKVRFEKEDKTSKKRVGIMCNNEHYTSEYKFKEKEPYILEIDSGFTGNIIIESNEKNPLKIPILEKSKDEIKIGLMQLTENTNYGTSRKSVASYRGMAYNKVNKSKVQEGDTYTIFEIGDKYLKGLENKVHTVTENMCEYFTGYTYEVLQKAEESGTILSESLTSNVNSLMSNESFMAGISGMKGDIPQAIVDNIKVKADVFKGLLGLTFETTVIKGRRFVALIGWLGKESIQKALAIAFTQGYNSSYVSSVKAKELFSVKSVLKGTIITTIIGSLIGIFDGEDKTFTEAVGIIVSNFAKAGASYLIGVSITIFLVTFAIASAPIAIVLGIGLSIFASFGLNYADTKEDGSSISAEYISKYLDEMFSFKIHTVEEGTIESLDEFLDYLSRGLDYFIGTGGYSVPYQGRF